MNKIQFNKNTFFSLFIFRCGVALLTIIHIISLSNDYDTLYSKNGIIREEVNNLVLNMLPVLSIHKISDWAFTHFRIEEEQAILIAVTIYIGALFCLCIGFFTRFSAIIAFILHTAFDNATTILSYGYDSFTNNLLLLCILMPVGYYCSIDNLIFSRKNAEDTPLSRLSIQVLRIHLCIVYCMSGINKTFGADWYNGECVWRAVMQPPLGNINMSFLSDFPFIATLLGIGVLILEIFYPLFISIKPIRPYVLMLVILMHLGIAITLNLWFFASIMIIWNIAAYAIPLRPTNLGMKPALLT
jgi:uncharacterized membrane protein YphA (DoxX/SURF4 family)